MRNEFGPQRLFINNVRDDYFMREKEYKRDYSQLIWRRHFIYVRNKLNF